MKRFVLACAVAGLVVPAALARTRNISVDTDGADAITSCDQVRVTYDRGDGYRAQESVPVSGLRTLKVDAARNGGIYVSGGRGYSVTACKSAELQTTLGDLRTTLDGNQVSATGPDSENWVVYFIVTVPQGGTLGVESHNGPISVRDVDASVTAIAHNGPISLKNAGGTLEVSTQNGPISLSGGSGNVKLNAQNGPISVNLEDSWNGSLDAHTKNGPLAVHVPANFRSGTVIESDGHGPVSCRAEACRSAVRSYDDEDSGRARRIEFGSGPTVVHMSTSNGPLTIKED